MKWMSVWLLALSIVASLYAMDEDMEKPATHALSSLYQIAILGRIDLIQTYPRDCLPKDVCEQSDDPEGLTPVHAAIMADRADIVLLFMRLCPAVCIPAVTDKLGRTARTFAAHAFSDKTLAMFATHGVDLDTADDRKITPLQSALIEGATSNMGLLRLLLQKSSLQNVSETLAFYASSPHPDQSTLTRLQAWQAELKRRDNVALTQQFGDLGVGAMQID